MLISVIVPIYNSENFLNKCLNSLKNQTHKEMEFILVNDGSTDDSASICEKFSKTDERFTIVYKKKGGVSSARNTGLALAKGQYIGFVDPDDWIEPEMFEKLLHTMTKHHADLSMGGYRIEKVNGDEIQSTIVTDILTYDKTAALDCILEATGFQGFTWNKLFRTDLIRKEPSITFDEMLHFGEDLLFCCEYISRCTTIVYNPSPLYHYIIHHKNATSPNHYSPLKLNYLHSLKKVIDQLHIIEGVNTKLHKTFFIDMNLFILRQGLQEKKITASEIQQFKQNLYTFRLNDLTSNAARFYCLLARINIHAFYYAWRLRHPFPKKTE